MSVDLDPVVPQPPAAAKGGTPSNKDILAIWEAVRGLSIPFYGKPRSFRFLSSRLFCLHSVRGSSTLHEVDLKKHGLVGALPDASKIIDPHRKLSKEEELLRQRKREQRIGITSYEAVKVAKAGEKDACVLFNAGPNVYLLRIRGDGAESDLYDITHGSLDLSAEKKEPEAEAVPESESEGEGEVSEVPKKPTEAPPMVKMDVKFDPSGSAGFYTFVYKNEIYMQGLTGSSAPPTRLTNETQDGSLEHISAGVADYIIQEEFDRTTGYWVCPGLVDGNVCVAYLRTDSSMVPRIAVPKGGFDTSMDTYYYPRPGEKNAVSCLVTILVDPVTFVVKGREVHDSGLPKWCEYVVDAGWVDVPDAKKKQLWLKCLDRRQKRFQIRLYDPFTHATTILHDQSCPDFWINVSEHIYFFKDGSGRVIIGSENISKFHHLYLLTPTAKGEGYTRKALTAGDWQVMWDTEYFVNEEKSEVFFVANRDRELEGHVYVSKFEGSEPARVTRLTTDGSSYIGVQFDEGDFSRFVATQSNLFEPWRVFVWTREEDGSYKRGETPIDFVPDARKATRAERASQLCVPTPFSFTSPLGHRINGVVYSPTRKVGFGPAPLILYTYGGPHVQIIKNTHETTCDPRAQFFSKMGYYYVKMDAEGSRNRGAEFERVLYKKMGQSELETQMAGITYLKESMKLPFDLSRVGVYGYSYGGYLTLLALSKHKSFFKVGVSGSPVTDWKLYDTAYTERYMDLPEHNEDGYEKGSVLSYVEEFPDEPHRVLLCHGMADENVMFSNTEVLVHRLVEKFKSIDIKIYPLQRHMFTSYNARLHSTVETFRYFVVNL